VLVCYRVRDTSTLGVQQTPNQTNVDMTFSRSCNQGKITKKDAKIIMDAKKITKKDAKIK